MKVAIVHPWFPEYRKPFFDLLLPTAARLGIDIDVFHGPPPPEWKKRGDAVKADYAVELPTKFINLRGKTLTLKSLKPLKNLGPYDLVILEQAVRNLETYLFLFLKRNQKLAFWGHGKSYTQGSSSLQEWVKQRLTRRGGWFFAYTAGGARAVKAAGFDENHITIVENSIDSSTLSEQASSISREDIADFRRKQGLGDHTALFIGGIDKAKRVSFLLEAAAIAHQLDNRFRLVIAGSGDQEEEVRVAAQGCDWLKYLGKVQGREKALVMMSCDALSMPGRVGLVAVDSFAVGRPIVTTNWPYHAPEFEYLRPNIDCIVSEDSVGKYAQALVDVLSDRETLERLQNNCLGSQRRYTTSNMVNNFVTGLVGVRNAYSSETT